MKRERRRDGVYQSREVAKILNISARTLYRLLAAGRIREPMRNPTNGYRIWTEVDIQELREALRK